MLVGMVVCAWASGVAYFFRAQKRAHALRVASVTGRVRSSLGALWCGHFGGLT